MRSDLVFISRALRFGALALCTAAFAACSDDDAPQGAQAQTMRGGRGGPGGPGGERVMPVEAGIVQRGSIARTVSVSGVIEPIRTVGVNSQLAGAVLEVLAEEGSAVRRGATLARLDDRELAAQLRAAEASFQVAKAAYERAEQLRDRKVITIPEYERDRTAYEAARAQYDQLRTRVGYATVRAPVAGVVTEKSVEAGDVVSTNARLFSIADISALVVRMGVSELDIVELNEGDPVRVQLDAYPDQELRGRIRRIFPAGDPTTRLVPVEVQLDPTSARHARPGFLARATFALSTHEGVLLVPQSAIVGAQGNEAVFVIEADKAIRRTVETGLTSLGQVEIRSGLQEGEQIVTVGSNSLRDGMSVRAIPAGGAAAVAETAPGASAGASQPGGAR
jgi:RND family efflux transporter MFP subunit